MLSDSPHDIASSDETSGLFDTPTTSEIDNWFGDSPDESLDEQPSPARVSRIRQWVSRHRNKEGDQVADPFSTTDLFGSITPELDTLSPPPASSDTFSDLLADLMDKTPEAPVAVEGPSRIARGLDRLRLGHRGEGQSIESQMTDFDLWGADKTPPSLPSLEDHSTNSGQTPANLPELW